MNGKIWWANAHQIFFSLRDCLEQLAGLCDNLSSLIEFERCKLSLYFDLKTAGILVAIVI